MKFKIAICDNEEKILTYVETKIKSILEEMSFSFEINAFVNPLDLMESLSENIYDILFLDIDMPNISGLEIARSFKNSDNKPLLIFVTNHDELVYDSLNYHPFAFIRKGYFKIEIRKVLTDVFFELSKENDKFCFKINSERVLIKYRDILYFEADGNYLKLYSKENNYRFRDTISTIENALNQYGFIRVHKGFLVNEQAVYLLKSNEIRLINKTSIPIGRNYAESAKKHLAEYMMR